MINLIAQQQCHHGTMLATTPILGVHPPGDANLHGTTVQYPRVQYPSQSPDAKALDRPISGTLDIRVKKPIEERADGVGSRRNLNGNGDARDIRHWLIGRHAALRLKWAAWPGLPEQVRSMERPVITALLQKLRLAAPALSRSCIALATWIVTPSMKSSCVYPRALAQGGHAQMVPPRARKSSINFRGMGVR